MLKSRCMNCSCTNMYVNGVQNLCESWNNPDGTPKNVMTSKLYRLNSKVMMEITFKTRKNATLMNRNLTITLPFLYLYFNFSIIFAMSFVLPFPIQYHEYSEEHAA